MYQNISPILANGHNYSDPIFYQFDNIIGCVFVTLFVLINIIGFAIGLIFLLLGFYQLSGNFLSGIESIGKGGLAIIFSCMFWSIYRDSLKTLNHAQAALVSIVFVMLYVVGSKFLNVFKVPYCVMFVFGLILVLHNL